MDGYSKPYGYMKLLDWEQFLQRAIYVGVHSVRICRCSEREIEQSHHPIVVCRLLLLPQTAVLPQETVLQRDRQPPLETARLCLLPAVWTQVLQGGVLYSALEDDTPQYKAQRDLGGISNLCCVVRHWVSASHPCKIIISLPQLCQDYGSFSLTEKASLISTQTWDSHRIPSWGEHWMLQLRAGGQTALWFKPVKRHSVHVLWMWRPKSSAHRQGKQLSPAACSGCLGRQVKTKGLQAPLAKPPSTPKPWWPEPAMSHSCVT